MAIGLIYVFRLILLDEQVKTVILKFKKMAVIRYFVSVLNTCKANFKKEKVERKQSNAGFEPQTCAQTHHCLIAGLP